MVEIRAAATEAERERSLEIYNTVFPHRAVTMADVRSYEEAMVEHTTLLACIGGAVVGAAHAGIPPWSDHPEGVPYVLADRRRHGAGSELLHAISTWLGARGKTTVESSVDEDDGASLAWAARRGFVEVGRESRLVLELDHVAAPAVEPPAGVTIVTWAERPDLEPQLYQVYAEASPDIPGNEGETIEPYDEWLRNHMQGPGDRADATFVALADGDAVAYAKLSFTQARPQVASHDLTGVKRAWRGRGIARALKAAEILWAKDSGYARLETMNEQRNEPIRRLNERFGYRVALGRIKLRGPVGVGP